MAIGNLKDTKSSVGRDEFDWEIDSVVESLRALRDEALNVRDRLNRPVALPSKRVLAETIEVLASALFPHRLSSRQLQRESVDFFVGQALDASCRSLTAQIAIELEYIAETKVHRNDVLLLAADRVKSIIQQLPNIRQLLDSDIRAAYISAKPGRSLGLLPRRARPNPPSHRARRLPTRSTASCPNDFRTGAFQNWHRYSSWRKNRKIVLHRSWNGSCHWRNEYHRQ